MRGNLLGRKVVAKERKRRTLPTEDKKTGRQDEKKRRYRYESIKQVLIPAFFQNKADLEKDQTERNRPVRQELNHEVECAHPFQF